MLLYKITMRHCRTGPKVVRGIDDGILPFLYLSHYRSRVDTATVTVTWLPSMPSARKDAPMRLYEMTMWHCGTDPEVVSGIDNGVLSFLYLSHLQITH